MRAELRSLPVAGPIAIASCACGNESISPGCPRFRILAAKNRTQLPVPMSARTNPNASCSPIIQAMSSTSDSISCRRLMIMRIKQLPGHFDRAAGAKPFGEPVSSLIERRPGEMEMLLKMSGENSQRHSSPKAMKNASRTRLGDR